METRRPPFCKITSVIRSKNFANKGGVFPARACALVEHLRPFQAFQADMNFLKYSFERHHTFHDNNLSECELRLVKKAIRVFERVRPGDASRTKLALREFSSFRSAQVFLCWIP